MNFNSVSFLAFCLFSSILFHSGKSYVWRQFILFSTNVLFIASFVSSLTALWPLVAFLGTSYGFLLVFQKQVRGNILLGGCLAILVVFFVYFKKYVFFDFLPFLEFPYLILGFSYILFRCIHLIVDQQGGAIQEKISPIEFINYTCLFLSFVSGPIQRYQDHKEQLSETLDIKKSEALQILSRLITGYFKVVIVSRLLQDTFLAISGDKLIQHGLLTTVALYIVSCVCYTLYMYFNFTGYMDIIISLGRFYGFSLPENFTKPFSADSFLDFWGRWHITLSNWYKMYLFNPLLKTLAYRWPSPKILPYLGVIIYFVTFFVMGIWHGSTLIFAIYGVFLGFGVSVNKFYQVLGVKYYGKKPYKKLKKNLCYAYACRGLSIAYFMIALTCLWVVDGYTFLALASKLGIVGFLTSYLIMVIACGVAIFLLDRLTGFAQPMKSMKLGWCRYTWEGMKVFVVVNAIILQSSGAPEFVYEAF